MLDATYTLTFFGSDPRGVQHEQSFASPTEAREFARAKLDRLVAIGKTFRTVHILRHDGFDTRVVDVVRWG